MTDEAKLRELKDELDALYHIQYLKDQLLDIKVKLDIKINQVNAQQHAINKKYI